MRMRQMLYVAVCSIVLACSRRAQPATPNEDAGGDAAVTSDQPDAGTPRDSGVPFRADLCPQDATPPPPEDGGLIWQQGIPASVASPPDAGWVVATTDSECIALTPGAPPRRVSWAPIANPPVACDSATIDGSGNLGVAWCAPNCSTSYVLSDGSTGATIAQGWTKPPPGEDEFGVYSRKSGFLLMSMIPGRCTFARLLPPDASPGPAVSIDIREGDFIWRAT